MSCGGDQSWYWQSLLCRVGRQQQPGTGKRVLRKPYHDFQPSQPYPGADLILVRRGNSDVVRSTAVKLFDNQRLLGEGREHSFAANAQFEQLALCGVFKMPAS